MTNSSPNRKWYYENAQKSSKNFDDKMTALSYYSINLIILVILFISITLINSITLIT